MNTRTGAVAVALAATAVVVPGTALAEPAADAVTGGGRDFTGATFSIAGAVGALKAAETACRPSLHKPVLASEQVLILANRLQSPVQRQRANARQSPAARSTDSRQTHHLAETETRGKGEAHHD